MFRCGYSVALLVIAVAVVRLALAKNKKVYPDDCISYGIACSSLETSRMCGATDWCTSQGEICNAKSLITHKAKYLVGDSFNEYYKECGTIFSAFENAQKDPEWMNVKLMVKPGSKPFTVKFDFDGTGNKSDTKRDVIIRVDDTLVYGGIDRNEYFLVKPLDNETGIKEKPHKNRISKTKRHQQGRR